MAVDQADQIALADELQGMVLEDFKKLLQSGLMTPTDRSTLVRLLSQNGWTLDPSALPMGLRDKLTRRVDPLDFEEDD